MGARLVLAALLILSGCALASAPPPPLDPASERYYDMKARDLAVRQCAEDGGTFDMVGNRCRREK